MITPFVWSVTSDAEMVDALALFSPFKVWMTGTTPRTPRPWRFYVQQNCRLYGGPLVTGIARQL